MTAEASSWNPTRVCLPCTRVALLEDIWLWITSSTTPSSIDMLDSPNANDSAGIFFLTSAAGAGKTSISHSIAQRCQKEGILVSSFFFDRSISGMSSRLFTTMARDLARLDVGLCREICRAIRLDQSLITAPAIRQFQQLILAPCQRHRVSGILAIVVDDFDDGCNAELLDIFCNEVPKLPGNYRIFLTGRNGQAFVPVLSQKRHVHPQSIKLDEQANLNDVGMFAREQLKKVAECNGLNEPWPDLELTDAFAQAAGGLFLWVSTACQYLRKSIDVDKDLRSLVSSSLPLDCSTEQRMDHLYLTIMQRCNWEDTTFLECYGLLMGAIMTAKTPLSANALQALHGTSLTLPVKAILEPVASLLTGIDQLDQPIRPRHLSFRNLISSQSSSRRFYVNEREHSARLALLCLVTLNENVKADIPGLGYLGGPDKDIPKLDESLISEEVWYACKFWTAHILDVKHASADLIGMLKLFLSNHLLTWVEIMMSMGQFQTLAEVREWILVSAVPHMIHVSAFNVI